MLDPSVQEITQRDQNTSMLTRRICIFLTTWTWTTQIPIDSRETWEKSMKTEGESMVHIHNIHDIFLISLFLLIIFLEGLDLSNQGFSFRICLKMFPYWFNQFVQDLSNGWLQISWMKFALTEIFNQRLVWIIYSNLDDTYISPPFSAFLRILRLSLSPKMMFLQ